NIRKRIYSFPFAPNSKSVNADLSTFRIRVHGLLGNHKIHSLHYNEKPPQNQGFSKRTDVMYNNAGRRKLTIRDNYSVD
ncbi:MAG: hypothetical protein IJ679_02090, partial [Lachnospiraceae bacterium]|nr:hypothetical protein [Lachnospiraceae bacterium]